MPLTTQRLHRIVWLFTAAIAVCAYCCMPWWTVDDAFISYRYGRNLLEHGALTWNVGEPLVEGYTGILLPLLSALLLWLGLPLVNAVKILGILALLATLVLTQATLQRLGVTPLRRTICILLLSASPLLYLHSISGLETVFFMAALAWVFWALAGQESVLAQGRSATALAIALLLAGLSRPEGLALAGIVFIQVLLLKNRFKAFAFKRMISRILLLAMLPLLGYWLWRAGYYGAWLPNSFHAKSYQGWINLDSVIAFAKFCGYYLALPALGTLLVNRRAMRGLWGKERLMLMTGIVFGSICLVAYFHSHLWMNYGSRFFVPFLPFALMVLAYLSAPATGDASVNVTKIMRGSLVVFLILQMGIMGFRFRQECAFLGYYHWIVQDELIPVGKYLKAHLPEGSRVISFMDAGAVGYYSGMPIVDFGRLSDPYLVQPGLTARQVADYFYAANARAVVMSSEVGDTILYIEEAMQIIADPRFGKYVKVGIWGNRVDYPYWQHVFVRQDLRLLQAP
jgi:arabinofuranosyltransferase